MSELISNLKDFLATSYRAKAIIIQALVRFGLFAVTVLIFYSLKFYSPIELTFSNEVYLVISVLSSLLVLSQLAESIEIFLKRKFLSEFIFLDPLSLKTARRKFDLKAIISHVFPDMIKISENSSGKIIILISNNEREFDSYSYEKGKRKKIKSGYKVEVSIEMEKILLKNKNGITTTDLFGKENLIEEMNLFGSSYILPFVFREQLFGFIALPNPPSVEERITLKILATKSAIAIFNNILSSEIAIQKKYKREFEVAGKIEKNIFNYKIPSFHKYVFKAEKQSSNIIIEFFNLDYSEKLFLVLIIKDNSLGSEVVYSYILGKIYSITIDGQNKDIRKLKFLIENIFKEIEQEDNYEFVIASFNELEPILTFLLIGKNIKINDSSDSYNSKISAGWRYKADLRKSNELYIFFKKDKILSISEKK